MKDIRCDLLLRRFVAAAMSHHAALEAMDEIAANRHAVMISRLLDSILREGAAGQQGLAGLLGHAHPAVAGMVAVCILDLHTGEALAVLQSLARQEGLLGFRASVAIERWENGEWQRP